MKINIKWDEVSDRKFSKNLKEYARASGKTIEQTIDEAAGETAKRIAGRTQPFGLGKAKIEQFAGSIRTQANRGGFAGMRDGLTDPRQAHESNRRGRNRSVPKGAKATGNNWLSKADIQRLDDHVQKVSRRAGMEKAAWLDAGRKSFSSLVISAYFRAKLKFGYAKKSGRGLRGYRVEIGTNLNHSTISRGQLSIAIQSGLKTMEGKMRRFFAKQKQL
jgi:hypothetical protein